jgi:NnrU protein
MQPTLIIALLSTLFVATHIGMATARTRAWMVSRLGENRFVLLYSVTLGLEAPTRLAMSLWLKGTRSREKRRHALASPCRGALGHVAKACHRLSEGIRSRRSFSSNCARLAPPGDTGARRPFACEHAHYSEFSAESAEIADWLAERGRLETAVSRETCARETLASIGEISDRSPPTVSRD